MKDQFKGFELFNDIEDVALRNRNRAVVLTNITLDNTKDKLMSGKGAGLVLGYFKEIPDEDKDDVKNRYREQLIKEGYVVRD